MYTPKSIISYCDMRYFTASGYISNGFIYSNTTDPNYYYFKANDKNKKLLSRISCQKHKLNTFLPEFDINISEYDNMTTNGYMRIYDAGNIVVTKLY